MVKFFIWNVLFLFGAEYVRCGQKFTYAMARRCKEHICDGYYNYETFYRVNANDRSSDPEVAFEMHLAILASSNGHILLSPVERPKRSDLVYEFVVGGGENEFFQLRKMQGEKGLTSFFERNILSPRDFTPFWIKVMKDGLIEFGIEGAPRATLRYHDVDPLPVRFFSFTTWTGIKGKILYDCPFGINDNDPVGNSTLVKADLPLVKADLPLVKAHLPLVKADLPLVEAELTTPQKLLSNITRRGRGRPDGETTTVYVTGTIAGLRFDSDNCFLEATITLVMSWVDKAIAWQPEIYNGTDHLSVRNNEIWTPELVLYNSIGHGIIEPSESERILVTSEGVATLSLRTRQQVSCAFSDEMQYRWPRDEYECNFLIGPWSMQDHLTVDLLTNDSVANSFGATATPAVSTEWDIIHLSRSILTSQQRHRPHHGVSNSTSDEAQSAFKIHVSIRRKSFSFYLLLTIPFIVIVAMILLSFVLNPLSEGRVWFNCGMIVNICLFTMYLDTTVPSYTMPMILIFYTVTMFMLTAVLLIHVILQSYCSCLFYSRPMQATLTNKFFRSIVGLPPLKACQRHQIEDTMSRKNETDNAATEDNSKEEAVLVIDRLVFGIYLVVYVTMAVTMY